MQTPRSPPNRRLPQGATTLALSLALHAALLAGYLSLERRSETAEDPPAMSVQLVARPFRTQQPPHGQPPPHIALTRALAPLAAPTPIAAPPAGAASRGDLMAAPFVDGRRGLRLALRPRLPCNPANPSGDSRLQPSRPCAPDRAPLTFDLAKARGGGGFALEDGRQGAMQRYRDSSGDHGHPGDAYAAPGDYPGLNCAIIRWKALHLCETLGLNTRRDDG